VKAPKYSRTALSVKECLAIASYLYDNIMFSKAYGMSFLPENRSSGQD
jgi:hypothetical protein